MTDTIQIVINLLVEIVIWMVYVKKFDPVSNNPILKQVGFEVEKIGTSEHEHKSNLQLQSLHKKIKTQKYKELTNRFDGLCIMIKDMFINLQIELAENAGYRGEISIEFPNIYVLAWMPHKHADYIMQELKKLLNNFILFPMIPYLKTIQRNHSLQQFNITEINYKKLLKKLNHQKINSQLKKKKLWRLKEIKIMIYIPLLYNCYETCVQQLLNQEINLDQQQVQFIQKSQNQMFLFQIWVLQLLLLNLQKMQGEFLNKQRIYRGGRCLIGYSLANETEFQLNSVQYIIRNIVQIHQEEF